MNSRSRSSLLSATSGKWHLEDKLSRPLKAVSSAFPRAKSEGVCAWRTSSRLLLSGPATRRRIGPGNVLDEIIRGAVLPGPLRPGILGPRVFAFLAVEFFVDNVQQTRQPHQIRQKELSRELRVLHAR